MVTRDEEGGTPERESRRERRRAERDAKRDARREEQEQTEERIPPRRPEPDHDRGLAAWGPRILAPLAFFLAATILILLVSSALDHKKKESTPTVATTPSTNPTSTGTKTTGVKRTFYVIKEGDTLESIAAKKNTTVEDLTTLNPNIDPIALTPGQKIRIS